MSMKGLAAVIVAVGGLAGCGGTSTTYTVDATMACLTEQGLEPSREAADAFTQAAINGGFAVHVGETSVNVAFYRTAGDAKDNVTGFQLLGASEEGIYAKSNAELSWVDTPTADEKSAVDGCLR